MSTESVSAPVTLVTGADKGIGLETARRLAGAGYRVYLTARSSERGRAAAATAAPQFLELEVTSDESVRHAAGCVEQAGGDLDVLVNDAGITGPMRDPHDYTAGASPKRSHFSPAAKAALHARDQGRPITRTGGGDHCDNWNTGS
jgi:NAD(P)-dependent dehydrogenase (short-subunit alcohol dehydrogenase family)